MFYKQKSLIFCVSCFTLILILIGSALSGCALMDEFLFGELYGPYHHDAIVVTPSNVIRVSDKQYCILYNSVYSLQNGEFILESTRRDQDPSYLGWAQDIQTDGNQLYVCDSSSSRNGVAVFSPDFEYEGAIILGRVKSFLLKDNIIYYYETRQNDSQEEFYFCKMDQNSNELKTISKGSLRNEIIEVDGQNIYINSRGKMYWADGTEGVNYANGYRFLSSRDATYQDLQSLGFYYNAEVGTVMTNDQKVTVSYRGTTISSDQEKEIVLYPHIFVESEKLYFATYEFIKNENCTNDWCICHFGKSNVYEYEFSTEQLIKKHETNTGEYIIAFNSEGLTYYRNGTIIRDQQSIKTINSIEPYGEFFQRGQDSKGNFTRIGLGVFYDDGSVLWYSYSDRKDSIKDEYW